MNELTIFIALAGIPAALGVGIDRLLLNRSKGSLHHALLNVWIRLDETKTPDLAKLIAKTGVSIADRIFKPNSSYLLRFIKAFLLSASVTLLAIAFGEFLSSSYGLFEAIGQEANIVIQLILINFPFDFLTVYVTYHLLKALGSSNMSGQIGFITLDLAFAFIFALGCGLTALIWFDNASISPTTIYNLLLTIGSLFQPPNTTSGDTALIGAYISTTLIPTLIYMFFLLSFVVAKPILSLGKKYSKYFLERATEVKDSKELIVFTLLGWHFSVLVVIGKAASEIVSSLA